MSIKHRTGVKAGVAALALSFVMVMVPACKSAPKAGVSAQAAPADQLDAVIRETSDYLNKQLPKGNKLVILNIQSDFPALSEYIIDELIANTVNDQVFSAVDRRQLDTIRAELDFQMSGEVDDKTAQSVGQMAGAQIIVSGAVSRMGDLYRLRVRALSVQSAEIEGQFNRSIPEGATIAALVKSQATGYGAGGVVGGGTAAASSGEAVPAQSPAPAAQKVYKIGDKGPAGGFIFYDKGNHSDGWRYLEAAPADINRKLAASTENIDVGNARERAVGSGIANTRAIMTEANNRGGGFGWAAQACDALSIKGFDDWFLPSRDELNYMYGNLHLRALGNFTNDWYWSSTFDKISNFGNACFMTENFSDGEQGDDLSTKQYRVRAIRQF